MQGFGVKNFHFSIFKIQLEREGQERVNFDCASNELIFEAAKRQGVFMASYCKQGACGACTSSLVSGSVRYVRAINGAPKQAKPGDVHCFLRVCCWPSLPERRFTASNQPKRDQAFEKLSRTIR